MSDTEHAEQAQTSSNSATNQTTPQVPGSGLPTLGT